MITQLQHFSAIAAHGGAPSFELVVFVVRREDCIQGRTSVSQHAVTWFGPKPTNDNARAFKGRWEHLSEVLNATEVRDAR